MRKFFLFIAALCCAVTINATEGALPGKFSVAADKQVYFSQGNLQATTDDTGKRWTWSFATNQWDCVGNKAANTAVRSYARTSANGTVDLFGWNGGISYYGIDNSTKDADYSGDFRDWGHNEITNGGSQSDLWRTMTQDEWVYLFQTREDASSKYGAAKVYNKPGIVLLPDVWTLPSDCGFTPGMLSSEDWNNVPSTNNYNSYNIWSAMEAAGAVFLPASGFREDAYVIGYDMQGHYWSSTPYGTAAYNFFFTPTTVNATQESIAPCHMGFSVRLVREATAGGAQAIGNIQMDSDNPVKVLHDGQLFILRGDKTFTIQGQEVK